jgi:hypothetical protein
VRSEEHKKYAKRRLAFQAMARAHDEGEAQDWQNRARCASSECGIDIALFFADDGAPEIRTVRRECMRCTERGSCLAKALTLGPGTAGIWGGTTQAERRKYFNWRRRHQDEKDGLDEAA